MLSVVCILYIFFISVLLRYTSVGIKGEVSYIGFITVHGLNEGHIAPYTDIERQLTKYQTYIIMQFWYKSLQRIIEETITLLTKIKHI